jgi:phage-related minor tail protein
VGGPVSAAGTRTIKIRVDGDSSGLSRMADDGEKSLSRWGDRFASFGKAIALGVGAATVALVALGKSSVDAFVESETAQARLTDAYARFPKTANLSIEALREYNTELAKKVRFDDDALATGQATLAQFGLTGQQLRSITPLLADFAAKTGRDLPTAADTLGKAFLGNTRALKELGINYKSTGNQAKDVANITALLRQQVGGFAEKEGQTAAGRAEILKNQLGEVQEQIGSFLLPVLMTLGSWLLGTGIPALQAFASWFGEHLLPAITATWSWIQANVFPIIGQFAGFITDTLIPAISELVGWIQRNWDWLQLIVTALGGALVGLLAYTAALRAWEIATGAVTAAQALLNVVLNANPIGLVIVAVGALVAAFILLWNKSEGFRNFFIGAWETIKAAVQIAVSFIVDRWNGLMNFFAGIPGFFERIGQAIGNAISSGFKGAVNFIVGLVNRLIDGVNFLIRGVNLVNPFGDIPSIPHIPGLARGGTVTRGGLFEVGERGREIVSLPAGASVSSNRDTEAMLGGGDVAVRVFIGDRELTDLVRVEIDRGQRDLHRELLTGVGGGR